jgi:hypothetical protein
MTATRPKPKPKRRRRRWLVRLLVVLIAVGVVFWPTGRVDARLVGNWSHSAPTYNAFWQLNDDGTGSIAIDGPV